MKTKFSNKLGLTKRRSAALLPNLLTTASLLTAFYSLVASWQQDYIIAAATIIIAAFLDAFDGRIARLTKSTSSFGEHYDSLADVIAFGVAPAFLAFSWGIHTLGNVGIALCFIYMACCCVRLARFAVGSEGGYRFRGMPSPTGGGYVASLIWLFQLYPLPNPVAISMVALVLLGTGLLMVSSLPFISGRPFRFLARSRAGLNIILVIFYCGLLVTRPAETLFISGCLYILFAFSIAIQKLISEKRRLRPHKSRAYVPKKTTKR